MGPDRLAESAMQTMTTILQHRAAAAFDDGQVVGAGLHPAAEEIFNGVRDLLSRTSDGSRAFNEFVLKPHDPPKRDQFKEELASALQTELQHQIKDLDGVVSRLPKRRISVRVVAPVVILGFLGVGLIGSSVVDFGSLLGLTASRPWLGLSTPWSLIVGLMIKLALMASGTGILVWCLARLQRARLAHTHTPGQINPVPASAARKLQVDAGKSKTVKPLQAKVFASAVLWPTDIRQRVVETYIPERNTVKKRVQIEVQLPIYDLARKEAHAPVPRVGHPAACVLLPGESGRAGNDTCALVEFLSNESEGPGRLPEELRTVYFPVLIPPKGRLQDNLDIYGPDGMALPVLAYREYLQLTAGTLRLLLEPTGNAPVSPEIRTAERLALSDIMQRRLRSGQPITRINGQSAGDMLRSAISPGASMDTVVAFVEKLRENYAIVALVHPDERGRFSVTYEQTIIPPESYKRISEALGARPLDIHVDLENASTCQSYHLRVQCPDHLYLRRQKLIVSSETLQRVQLDAPTVAHTRFQKRLGQAYAHFYARFFPQTAPRDSEPPKIEFSFCEVPPASVFRAAVAAVACFLLIWAVGVVISRRPDPGTDAPAFLLAFPAVAAAFLGFEKQSRSLLDSTLHARLSLIATGLLSILASALFMAVKALSPTQGDAVPPPVGGWLDWPRIVSGSPILGITNWLWILLALLAMLNALVTVCAYVARLTTFAYLRSRNGVKL